MKATDLIGKKIECESYYCDVDNRYHLCSRMDGYISGVEFKEGCYFISSLIPYKFSPEEMEALLKDKRCKVINSRRQRIFTIKRGGRRK